MNKNKISNQLIFFIITSILLLFSTCKQEQFYTGDPLPSIINPRINQINFKQFTDTIRITFDYVDGDGDLGFESADSLNLEVKDTRFAKADYYHFAPLLPLGKAANIHGSMSIRLKNIFLLGAGNIETTNFQIRIKDRAQHWSNKIITKTISVTK